MRAVDVADQRWKDLYRLGYLSSLALIASIALAVIAFFIFPYTPGFKPLETIFADLQTNRLGGLIALDLPVVILLPVMSLNMLALYVALKSVNDSYALIALVLGLIGIGLWLTARPLVEMVYLSDQHAAATSELAKSQYLAAGESLHALFNGTAWVLSQFLIAISSTISSVLMLRSKFFSRATAYLGIGLALFGYAFWIPQIGAILSLLGTIGGVIWYGLMARDFYRLGWAAALPT